MRQKCGPPPSPPPTHLQFVLAEKRGKAGKADGKGKHSRVKLVHKMQIRKAKSCSQSAVRQHCGRSAFLFCFFLLVFPFCFGLFCL